LQRQLVSDMLRALLMVVQVVKHVLLGVARDVALHLAVVVDHDAPRLLESGLPIVRKVHLMLGEKLGNRGLERIHVSSASRLQLQKLGLGKALVIKRVVIRKRFFVHVLKTGYRHRTPSLRHRACLGSHIVPVIRISRRVPLGKVGEFVRKSAGSVTGVALEMHVGVGAPLLADDKNFLVRKEQGVCDAFVVPVAVMLALEVHKPGLGGGEVSLFHVHV